MGVLAGVVALGEIECQRVDDRLGVAVDLRGPDRPVLAVALVEAHPVGFKIRFAVAGVDRRHDGPGAVDRQFGGVDRHRGVGEIKHEPVFERGGVDRSRVDAVDGRKRSLRKRDVVDGDALSPLLAERFDHGPAAGVGERVEPLLPDGLGEGLVVAVVDRVRDRPRKPAMASTWIGSSVI
ncbi:MAG: hypothetical protein A07HN63_01644, partial [uncultured archaeon A07HN63]